MDRRKIPVIFSLSAGAISLIFTMIKDYSLFNRTWILLVSILIFFFLGAFIQWLLDLFDEQNEKQKKLEGEMVEKNGEDKNTAQKENNNSAETKDKE